MSYTTLGYEVADRILALTLQRPDRLNAMDPMMLSELTDAFERAERDDVIRVVIVTGAGRAFCAGADVKRRENTFDYTDAQPGNDAPRDRGGILALRIMNGSKPVIAAVNGAAVGAGATFTLPMDVRIASTQARFGFVFTRRGIVPESCSSWFLPRIVGMGRALEWVATGRVFGAQEALEAGLVHRICEPDQLLPAARQIGREIVERTSPVSVAMSRRLLWEMCDGDPMEAHLRESRGIFHRGLSADAREGVSSFRERRLPVFPDRVSAGMPDLTTPARASSA